ncbi:MAG: hypothetical protein Q7V57_01475 [Actinomycetota bacterium]|nr:hypothetical protein [Actinomycetota bacterium]
MAEPVEVRPLAWHGASAAADDAHIRGLFGATMLLGGANRFPLALLDEYTEVCLGWYLRAGRADVGLAVDTDGTPLGYALVCADNAAQAAEARRATIRLARRVSARLVTARLDPASRRFYAHRLRDSVALWRTQHEPPMPAHAHLNVGAGSRSGRAAATLRDHIDERCRLRGLAGWYGEINAKAGHREQALERLQLHVLHRTPNHTLSRALGAPVLRLTVVRDLGTLAAAERAERAQRAGRPGLAPARP